MAVTFFIVVLATVSTSVFSMPQTSGVGCKGLLSGAIKEENGYYYKCNNGMLDPVGCISSTKQQVPIGETFQMLNFQMRCVLNSNGFMDKEYVGCIVDGKVILPGSFQENEKVWHTCKNEKFFVELSSGCMHEQKRLNKGESAKGKDLLLECHDTDNGPSMIQTGCMVKGVEYKIGDSFEDEDTVYSCSTEKNLIKRKVIGCFHNGKRMFDKDSYFDGDFIYMCKLSEKGAKIVQTGCVHRSEGKEIGKNIDCIWIDGQSPNQYHTICKKSPTTGQLSIEKINCFYAPVSGVIEPGCYRTVGDVNVGCKKTDKSMELVTFPKTTAEKSDIPFGLSLC